MSAATERIPVLVTKSQKARLVARAKEAGLSTGEFLRRAGEEYSPSEDEELLKGLLTQVEKSTLQAEKAIDDALAFVAESEKRLAKLGAGRRERKAA
ncbi:MAG: hypothetical protein AB1710_10315 [Pseudomonadota bacterium]